MSRILSLLAALGFAAMAVPAIAQTTNFDGNYVGTAATFRGAMRSGANTCPNFPAPPTVTVAGGHAQGKWADGVLRGEVTAAGAVVMRTDSGGKFEGQIDPQGTLSGNYSGFCNYTLAWQKKR